MPKINSAYENKPAKQDCKVTGPRKSIERWLA